MRKLEAQLIADLPPFRKLPRSDIRDILDKAKPRRIDKGSTVFEEGQPADRFYLLLDGYLRVVKTTPNGDQVIVLHIASGQLFGIAAALGKTVYPATAVAARDCLALQWPNALWPEFTKRYEGFATETYQVVGNRLEETNNRVVELATQHVEQRVAATLLRLINQAGKNVDTGVEIDFPITRQDISEMTGTTMYTVSRMMAGLEKDGIVASSRSKIVVTDPEKLLVLSEWER